MLPFVSQVTENQPKYRSIWISGGGKYVSNHLCIVKIKSNRHWMNSFNLSPEKNHLQIPYQNQQRLTSLISKGLGLFVSPAFGFMSGKEEPSGTVIL